MSPLHSAVTTSLQCHPTGQPLPPAKGFNQCQGHGGPAGEVTRLHGRATAAWEENPSWPAALLTQRTPSCLAALPRLQQARHGANQSGDPSQERLAGQVLKGSSLNYTAPCSQPENEDIPTLGVQRSSVKTPFSLYSKHVPKCKGAHSHTHMQRHTHSNMHTQAQTQTYAHTEMPTCSCRDTHSHMHTQIHTDTHMQRHIHTHVCTHRHTYTCGHTCM